MPRHRAILDKFLLVIASLLLMGGFIALGFLKDISTENRALLILISSIGLIGCMLTLAVLAVFRRWLRRRVWLRTMTDWEENLKGGLVPEFSIATDLEENLWYLAIQTYSRMGYRVLNQKIGEYIQLMNPDGKIELVACIKQSGQVQLHQVYSLALAMRLTKAVRGFFWAPSGFTNESIAWVAHRTILLVDRREMERLSGYAARNGSHWLEY